MDASMAGKTVKYCGNSNYTQALEAGYWYYTAPAVNGVITQYKATSGFVVTTSNGGAWYPDWDTYAAMKNDTAPNITLLSDVSFTGATLPATLTVDVNGHALTLPGDLSATKLTRLTITDKVGNGGSVSAIATDRSAAGATTKTGLTLSVTNASVASISLVGRANSVTLNNATVSNITMDGTTYDAKGALASNKQTLTTSGGVLSGTVAITGDASAVSLTDTKGGAAVNVTSEAGSVLVGGASVIGQIAVKNRVANSTKAVPTVTINGGTVAGITDAGRNTTAATTIILEKTATGPINITGEIYTAKGNVTVKNATTQNITVLTGSLNVTGPNNVIGDVALAGGGATTLSIDATNSSFSKIAASNGGDLTISKWPAGRVNYYATLELNGYAGRGVKGGVFGVGSFGTLGAADHRYWFSSDLQFLVKNTDGRSCSLYGKTELTQAISDIAGASPAKSGDIALLGQADGTNHIVLKYGALPWAYITYTATTAIILPTVINNTPITTWYAADGTGYKADASTSEAIPYVINDDVVLTSNLGTMTASKITNVTINTPPNASGVVNKDIKVTLNGNNIHLSGAVSADVGDIASIYVDLTTDALDSQGNIIVIEKVLITYDINTKRVAFSGIGESLRDDHGAIIQNGELVLNDGTGQRYNVTANLVESASSLKLYQGAGAGAYQIQATVGGKLSSWTPTAKQELIDKIQRGEFTINGNRAVLEAINAAQATITNNTTVTNWLATARQAVWKNGFKGGSLDFKPSAGNYKDFVGAAGDGGTNAANITNAFKQAWLVPYLVVNITEYSENGTLTATLTPYYRIDVGSDAYNAAESYTVQAGRTLGELTGDMRNPVKVKFDLGSVFNTLYMHQDGKYVYQAAAQEWSIYHAGSAGLGTVVINSAEGPISFDGSRSDHIDPRPITLPAYTYDTLQAAIDDTLPGKTVANTGSAATTETMDTIVVKGTYSGSCAISMTGQARKVRVVGYGNLPITANSQNVDVQNVGGYTYTVQLKQDTAEAGKNIVVASATGGSASVNANPATAGQTVTITLSPSSGYTANGVSVKTSSGGTVSVSGSGNSYTFTMPSGTVTVTPSFKQNQAPVVNPTITVGNPTRGSGTAVTNAGTNQVAPGSTVTVTTAPASGQRTMGLTVTGATANRTGANTFTFTVPSGYNTVVVTPQFDVNNGTLFTDVWSSEYFSPAVAWAVSRGITNGTSTYTFGSYNTCTREDMVTFLWRAAGSPVVTNTYNPFWDVQVGSYYYNAVLWAVSKGITNGVSANQFGVGQHVTRGQAVTFLYRYNGSPSASTNSGFYDVPGSEYYAKAVSWANSTGVTNGTSTTTFSPNSYCQRAQIVTFLYRNATGIRA